MTNETTQPSPIDEKATNFNFILNTLIDYVQNFILYSLWAVIATLAALAVFLAAGVVLASKFLLIAALAIITLNPYVIAAIVVTVALVAAFITIRDMFKEIDKTYPIEEVKNSHNSKGSDSAVPSDKKTESRAPLSPMEIETQTGSTPSWVSKLFTSVLSLFNSPPKEAGYNQPPRV
jgi:hypothetical protein